jgi:hypothetical protein
VDYVFEARCSERCAVRRMRREGPSFPQGGAACLQQVCSEVVESRIPRSLMGGAGSPLIPIRHCAVRAAEGLRPSVEFVVLLPTHPPSQNYVKGGRSSRRTPPAAARPCRPVLEALTWRRAGRAEAASPRPGGRARASGPVIRTAGASIRASSNDAERDAVTIHGQQPVVGASVFRVAISCGSSRCVTKQIPRY